MTLSEADAQALSRAEAIPGRALTRSKAPGRMYPVGAGPLFAGGDGFHGVYGCMLRDANGRDYVDMICALGAVTIGHGASISRETAIYSLPSIHEGHAAEAVLRSVAPWASRVRFLKTGSEATHAAYRIAKRATRRSYVLAGATSYHGWHEWCDDRDFPFTIRYEHHDEDLYRVVAAAGIHATDVAAVFVEPHRWQTTSADWVLNLRRFCENTGALLVFDEIIYGLRWAMGGSVETTGVVPDLACYGKALGNGAPIACVVGRDEMVAHGELPSGTYSGEVGALRSVTDVLDHYETHGTIERLWERGRQLRRGLRAAVAEAGVDGRVFVEGAGEVHQRLRFADDADGETGRTFAAGMASRGVLWNWACANVMEAHGVGHIEHVVDSAHVTLLRMAREGLI